MARLLGDSQVMRLLREHIARVGPTGSTVLIQGETGTGKELVAQALHSMSGRARQGLFVIDCGALAANLIESELFGHERGAFTGATASSAGLFERAHGGTLFLDEIGELPLEMQPRLLRVLESRAIRRVGGGAARAIDVRVIAATHRDLLGEVRAGRFREDLYYRLEVVSLTVPPLRTRLEDLNQLVGFIVRELGGVPERYLTQEVIVTLLAHDWPGNVRELRNILERAVALDEAVNVPRPTRSTSPAPLVDVDVPFHRGKGEIVRAYERAYVSALLAQCGGNVSEAARRAGLERGSIYRIMRRAQRADEQLAARLSSLALAPPSSPTAAARCPDPDPDFDETEAKGSS
jgi:DNA-binding NtrC family response regulator